MKSTNMNVMDVVRIGSFHIVEKIKMRAN